MRSLIFASAFALAALLTGCQTPHTFLTPDSTWKAHVGQLKFSNRKRTLIGNVVVQQRGPAEFQLDFIKGGGLPLMSVRQDAATSRAEGILVHGSWQGAPESAPRALRGWMKLRESFADAAANIKRMSAPVRPGLKSRDSLTPPRTPNRLAPIFIESAFDGDGQLNKLLVTFADDQQFVFQFNH